jgi:pimeloyl-ACP methyl ester carboxylesterase
MEPPQTRYARSGDVYIAYQLLGGGLLDLVYISGLTQHVEHVWETHQAPFLRRLATLGRLIRFDKRGTGMSDRDVGFPTLETRMDDIRAVMDAAESEKAVLIGYYDGGALASLFAATYPERTSGLVLFHALPRAVRSPELPWLETRRSMSDEVRSSFAIGTTVTGWRRTGWVRCFRAPRQRSSRPCRATTVAAAVRGRCAPSGARMRIWMSAMCSRSFASPRSS